MIEPVILGDCQLFLGDCELLLRQLPDNSVDSIVTDPPAGISFMGKEWDKDKGGRDKWILWMTGIATECLRVLKPGGHAVVWSLPRTSHWTATAWENAGFEVRDRISHVFGSGFPKSLDVSKAIDREAGEERDVIGKRNDGRYASKFQDGNNQFTNAENNNRNEVDSKIGLLTKPALPEAQQWDGWGTALKPAVEDWWLLRKPLSEKTVAQNVLKWGTGALNINACRIESESIPINKLEKWSGFGELVKPDYEQVMNNKGRFPANLIHDGSDEVVSLFPETESGGGNGHRKATGRNDWGMNSKHDHIENNGLPQNTGSASRFFYCAKPNREERDRGLNDFELIERNTLGNGLTGISGDRSNGGNGKSIPAGISKIRNYHPTVKPLALMEYLIRLVTPPSGIVLDCFLGSGSTLVAAAKLGFKGIGIEKEEDYLKIAIGRIKQTQLQMRMDI